ncbi:MAG: PulJ/GspJ family protein [Roseibacillus sp.]
MKSSLTISKARAGFSLIEVLVAAGVGTAIILMMAMAMRVGTDGFNEATRRIDALVEARAALGVMADDVSTMVGTGEEEFGWSESEERFHEVWFLSVKPIEAQDPEKAVGDVCFVHYFTAVTPDAPVEGAASSRKLYRRLLSSGDVINDIAAGKLPEPDPDPDRAEAIAFNVTRFEAQPLARPVEEGPLIEWVQGGGLPVSLGIDFQVVDGDTAALMRSEEDWNLTSQLAQTLILTEGDDDESNKGRDFQLNLEIGHAN